MTRLITPLVAISLLAFTGCPNFGQESEVDFSKLKCDASGCLLCEQFTCYQYSCETDWQCPEGYGCTAQKSCMPTSGATQAPGLGGGGGGGAPIDDGQNPGLDPVSGAACTISTQCGPGLMCVNGACQTDAGVDTPIDNTPACAGTADCGAGEFCNAGICDSVAFPLRPEGTCQFNLDCGAQGTCINTKCYFPAGVDNACPHGASLTSGLCLPTVEAALECQFNSDCGHNTLCINATCETICTADADCSKGNYCGGSGLCVLDDRPTLQCLANNDCASQNSCVDGRCLAGCEIGSACSTEAEMCSFGFCMPTSSCFAKPDCSTNFDCINGHCGTLGNVALPENPIEGDDTTPEEPANDPPADDAPPEDAGGPAEDPAEGDEDPPAGE